MKHKIIPIVPESTPAVTATANDGNDRDWGIIKTMMDYARPVPQKNVTSINIQQVNRTTRLALILMPEWGVYFPPYNLSRLSSVARAAGYSVSVWDLNIRAYHYMRGRLDFDPWDPAREFYWLEEQYEKELHPHLEPAYREYLKEIVASNPDVIGFSLYYTNETNSRWMVQELRKLLPGVKIVAGGPQAYSLSMETAAYFDHVVQGEGEQILLDLLEQIEKGQTVNEHFLIQPKNIRLNLDSFPFPDYTDYDLNLYQVPNGSSSEFSRGCVAQCVFCTEVHFWKYRGRMSNSVLDEIEYQYHKHGSDNIWFIDSLVNGNLNELRAFALGVVERGLKIKWQGYARCDRRMDLDFYRDLKASGCESLDYGIESGSPRVLSDMKKYITVDDIEENLTSGAAVGIHANTNWIIGFPTEETTDFAKTLSLVWRIRNKNILSLRPGLTMILSPGAEISTNQDQYSIAKIDYMGNWTTKNMLNTKLHRMIRQKNFLIFLSNLNSRRYIYGFERPRLGELYTVTFKSKIQHDIDYEEFNYNIISTGINRFADSVVNEIWALLRTLWRARGAFKIAIKNDPELDLKEWGQRLGCNYTGYHNFSIDDDGSWTADFYYNFVQDANTDQFKWPDRSFEFTYKQTGQWKRTP
jgi:radical SAM superfamily enzyme YgiQ (UPF0313 family)